LIVSETNDYARVKVDDDDWAWAADEAPRRRWQPDRPVMRPRHSQHGTKEEILVGERVLKRWLAEQGVRLDRHVVRRVSDYGDLLVPPGYRPGDRHVSIIRATKRPGYQTSWTITGWCWGREASDLGALEDALPRPAYIVTPRAQRTPAELIASLRDD
jgi:hypothetical protein